MVALGAKNKGEPSDLNLSLDMASPVTAEEAVPTELRRAIREGLLVPGQRLTQSEIAGQLGVSRIPLRDALRRLEVESLVKIEGHKGARVTELTADDGYDLTSLKQVITWRDNG